jgi:hypothetical protein
MVGPSFLAGIVPQPLVLVLLWFGLNGFALGSPTRRAEIVWIAAGMAIIAAFRFLPGHLVMSGALDLGVLRAAAPYLGILHSAIVLTVLYRLFLYQVGPHQLYRYLNPDRA